MSKQEIYVSRLIGHDSRTCGQVSSPCRTIHYGIQQLSTGHFIYLDGTNTLQNPYACQASDPGLPGIYLTKNVSFVSMKSPAHISCLHGNPWLVSGNEYKHGIRISFSGLAFLNTPVLLHDALVTVDDTVFTGTQHVSLDIQVKKLSRFELSLNNIVFKKNTACIRIKLVLNPSSVFVNITNAVFHQNGDASSNVPSILQLNSFNASINIEIRNCSFEKNTFKEYGMILVRNLYGATNVSLKQFRMEENRQINPSIKRYSGLFLFISHHLFLRLEYGYIYKTSATFLCITRVQLAAIKISNIDMDKFYSGSPGGGVVNAIRLDSCYLSIKDSSFRNGKNYEYGGILFIVAKKSVLTIQNSTIHNISSSSSGGAVYIQSDPKDYPQSTNRNRIFFVFLRIINSSFSHTSSGKSGGALSVFAQAFSAIIRDSSFLHCNATLWGGVLFSSTTYNTIIRLHNSYFLKNSGHSKGIVYAELLGHFFVYSFNVSIKNVTFSENRLFSELMPSGVAHFEAESLKTKITVDFKHTYFIKNLAGRGSSIFIGFFDFAMSRFVTLDNCIFRNNFGNFGAVFAAGVSTLTINDSVFLRNKNTDGAGGAFLIHANQISSNDHLKTRIHITRVLFQENIATVGSVLSVADAEVLFTNCTLLNNFALFHGGLIVSLGGGSTNLTIIHSVFMQTIRYKKISAKKFMTTSFLRLFTSDTLAIVNTTFDKQTISDDPHILVPEASKVSIDNTSVSSCPLGHNIEKTYDTYKVGNDSSLTGLSIYCNECDYNFYSLQRGTARGLNVDDGFQCLPCPRGADCVSTIKSKTNYWGYHVSLNPPKLAFTICPFGYCKSPPTNSTEYNSCQGKRSGVMCGMCSQGYTEALWSTYCTPVNDCHDHWFWILFLVYVFFIAIILVFKPPFVTYCLDQIFWFKQNRRALHHRASLDEETSLGNDNVFLSSAQQHKQDKRQFSRFEDIIFYFYQIAQLILSSSSLKEFFNSHFRDPVLGFFNFQPSFMKRGFLCPFPGLTPETKLVFKITPVFGTLIAIFFIYAMHSFICRTRGMICPAIAPYFQASIKTIFLGYATMATVSISLIRCVFVANSSRWFYNGNITCYQWWQYVSFTFIAIFVIPFIFVLTLASLKLHHGKITVRQFLLAIIFPLPFLMLWLLRFACSSAVANVEVNQNINALKEMLLAPYRQPKEASKQGALYWQSVLIARRLILILIFCIVPEPSIRLFCMTIVCVIVLCFHLKLRPFQNLLANNLESLSLFFLIILGLINLFKSVFVGSEQNIKGSLVTVLKVFQWLETVMLGLFPAVLLLLLSFAVISFSFRVLIVLCKSIFEFLIQPCVQR